MQKLLTFFSKNIIIYAIFKDQSFNDTLTNDIISFEQLGPVILTFGQHFCTVGNIVYSSLLFYQYYRDQT